MIANKRIAIQEQHENNTTNQTFKMTSESIPTDILSAFLAKEAGRGESQIDRYRRLGAHPSVLELIMLGGGQAMGTKCERLLRDTWWSLKKRVPGQTGYDHQSTCCISERDQLLEQKTSGLWSDDPRSFRWQHLEPDHIWTGLLLVGITLTGLEVWGMTRAAFQTCIDTGLATPQGNKSGESYEGYWMTCADVYSHLIPIKSESDLQAFVSLLG